MDKTPPTDEWAIACNQVRADITKFLNDELRRALIQQANAETGLALFVLPAINLPHRIAALRAMKSSF